MKSFTFPPGATPLEDISGLKQKWIMTQEQLNQAESENIWQAKKKYLFGRKKKVQNWFNPNYLLKIHKELNLKTEVRLI